MQFLVLGYDGSDEGATQRRQAARPAHIELGNRLVAEGRHLAGAALLNEAGAMAGSALMVDFPDRSALEAWLAVEPYVTGKVWEKIEITPCQIGPSFQHVLTAKKTAK